MSLEIVLAILSVLFVAVVFNMTNMACTFRGLTCEILTVFHKLTRSNLFLSFVGCFITDNKVPKGLPQLKNFEAISDGTYRILGMNPSMHTLQGTNTWLLTGSGNNGATAGRHVLVDTGSRSTARKYVDLLFSEVFPVTGTKALSHILLTHGHEDHQGGVVLLLEELEKRGMLPLPQVHKRTAVGSGVDSHPAVGFACSHIEDNQVFIVHKNCTLRAIYTPGHTSDHVSFLLERDRAILSGDCVLGCGTAVFENLSEYMASLALLRRIVAESKDSPDAQQYIRRIYPGHGSVVEDALGKIDEYVQHRRLRERQVASLLAAMRRDEPTRWLSTWRLVDEIYGQLPIFVKFSAQLNLRHHLEFLMEKKEIERCWPDMWRACQPAPPRDSSPDHAPE